MYLMDVSSVDTRFIPTLQSILFFKKTWESSKHLRFAPFDCKYDLFVKIINIYLYKYLQIVSFLHISGTGLTVIHPQTQQVILVRRHDRQGSTISSSRSSEVMSRRQSLFYWQGSVPRPSPDDPGLHRLPHASLTLQLASWRGRCKKGGS